MDWARILPNFSDQFRRTAELVDKISARYEARRSSQTATTMAADRYATLPLELRLAALCLEIVAPRLERIAGGLDLRGHRAAPGFFSAGNPLMMPKSALGALLQRKPLESHGSITTARVHHAARRRGGGLAARGARATGGQSLADGIYRPRT